MNTVGKWLGEHVGVFVLLGVVLATVALVAAFNAQVRATGAVNPGTTIFSETGHFRVHTLVNRAGSQNCSNFCTNLTLSVEPGSTIRSATHGFMVEAGARGNLPMPNPPMNSPATNMSVTFNNSTTQSFSANNRQLNIDTIPARMQWVNTTSFVQTNGSGNYRLTDSWVQPLGVCCWPTQFMIVIEENPSFPLNQVAINDYYYSRRGNVVPPNIVATVNLPGLPEGYFQGEGTIWTLGAFFNANDRNDGSYQMGSAGGPLARGGATFNFAAQSWLPEGWGWYPVPTMDPDAMSLTLTVRFTGVEVPGADSAGFLIFQSAPFTVQEPEPPVVVTDTCYGEE